ncbi:MAG: hypothetical protein JRN20_16950 [Nitrososphaerota archaeon]|nr:hypothetical protein [Nitrososphaerota archaeon]
MTDSTENSNLAQPVDFEMSQRKFFGIKLVAVDSLLGLFAIIAGYLEYVLYPSVIANDFGESNIALKLSFLTFRYYATRCEGGYCARLAGVPAFDFFQLFIYLIVFYTVFKFIVSKK